MTITITQDTDEGGYFLGGIDPRHFKKDEVHTLAPAHEQELIEAGYAREGGDEEEAVERQPGHKPSPIEAANKISDAPMAVDTGATAAQAVADGDAQDPSAITHPDAVVETPTGLKSVNPVAENKAVEPTAETKAAQPAKATKAKATTKKAGK